MISGLKVLYNAFETKYFFILNRLSKVNTDFYTSHSVL